jgi:hypothetical protein
VDLLRKIKPRKTGGHHRVPESEIDRLFPTKLTAATPERDADSFARSAGAIS